MLIKEFFISKNIKKFILLLTNYLKNTFFNRYLQFLYFL